MQKKIQIIMLLILAVPSLAIAGQRRDDFSDERGIKKVVITATRSEERLKSVPAKIEVIDSKTIERTVGETITEQLKKNSSIGVIEYPGALAGIGIRGFRPEFSGITKHSVILINGRPAGATNLATILSHNIERIEVLKGPASSLYGGEAMGGVVNIITKKNTGKLTGMSEVSFGSFETTSQKVAVGGSLGKRYDFDFFARHYNQADNFRMGNGNKRANTKYETLNGSMRFGVDLGETWRVDISGDRYQGFDIETPGDIINEDNKSGVKDIARYGIDARIGGKLGENNKVEFTAYKTNETSESFKNYTGYTTPVQVDAYRSFDSDTDWFGLQFKNEYTWNGHRFITGFDYQDIDKRSRSYNQDGSRKAPYSPDEGRENWAGYVETIWKAFDERLTATAGGRYDMFKISTKTTPFKTNFTPNSENFSTFSPRAGLSYNFDQGFRLHTTVGRAFVPPSAAQLAGYAETVDSNGVTNITKGNADLDSETSLTYDVGVGYALSKWGISADVTYFNTDVNDKIIRTTSGTTTTYENSFGAAMEGLETDISFDVGATLNWERSVSFFINSTQLLKAKEELSDGSAKDIQNVAKMTVNYGVQYDDGIFDSKLNFRSQGTMKDTNWNLAGRPEVKYPTITVADLVINANFLDNHKITLKIDNLFDKDYFEKQGFPKPGRAFYGSYTYKF